MYFVGKASKQVSSKITQFPEIRVNLELLSSAYLPFETFHTVFENFTDQHHMTPVFLLIILFLLASLVKPVKSLLDYSFLGYPKDARPNSFTHL